MNWELDLASAHMNIARLVLAKGGSIKLSPVYRARRAFTNNASSCFALPSMNSELANLRSRGAEIKHLCRRGWT
jgi:hypothetical protein